MKIFIEDQVMSIAYDIVSKKLEQKKSFFEHVKDKSSYNKLQEDIKDLEKLQELLFYYNGHWS